MDALKEELLAKLKKLKDIEGAESDDVFLFALETAIFDVLDHCNMMIENFPDALKNTVLLMAVDVINETSFSFNADTAESETKSLTEGDFSFSVETKAEAYQKMMSAQSFSRNYKRNLNKYRKTR